MKTFELCFTKSKLKQKNSKNLNKNTAVKRNASATKILNKINL